jgi:hypothetical protein
MEASARVERVMWLLALMLFGIGCAPALAQSLVEPPPVAPTPGATPTDYIIVEGHSVRIPLVVAVSGSGGVHWLRTTRGGATLNTGVEAFSIASSRWTVGNLGGAFRPFDRVVLHSQARFGGGRLNGEPFDYRMYEAGMGYIATERLHLTLVDQYWHVAATRGHLIKPGLSWLPHRRLSADLTYARSAQGNLDANLVAGRVGVTIWSVTVIGGASEGRGAAELLDVSLHGAADKSLKERIAGLQIQLPRAQVNLFASDLDIAAVHKRTLSASIKYRLSAK